MHLPVIGAVIFRDTADLFPHYLRKGKAAIETGIKDGPIVFRTALNLDLTQLLIPYCAGLRFDGIKIIITDLLLQVGLGLCCADP